MALWVDYYRPKYFSDLDYHKEKSLKLKTLIDSGDFPHLLFHGPSGAGKKTRISCLLREIYGLNVDKLKLEQFSFTTPSNKKLEIDTLSSNYHIECNPSEVGIYDRIVIQELIKSTAQTQQLDLGKQKSFKVIVLSEVNKCTKDAQYALRRTMEKYITTCRMILCTNSLSKITPAIKSRCLCIRISSPTINEIKDILYKIAQNENIEIPDEFAISLAKKSNGNLRKCILTLQACKVQKYPFKSAQHIESLDWEIYIEETATLILSEQTPKRLLEVRDRLYELLVHCIPSEIIIRELLKHLILSCDDLTKEETIKWAAFYEHRLQKGNKAIFHLEAFVAKFMSYYKKFIESSFFA
ncbi:unnamed protein product [Gordionus sp. m RMFG-2023]|uniref:replication factor C subunit 3-like n=1 Tax=Gordionus sp. m RMFG-2023 TaxID=3053472 RepID=UPI0030DFD474